MITKTHYPGIYFEKKKGKIYTINQAPGKTVYAEKLITEKETEYREWDPYKSKLCAAIKKGIKKTGLHTNSFALYLGAASGTTVSHVSDIVKDGIVFAVETSFIVTRDLVFVAKERKNIAPILASANHPEEYAGRISQVDWMFQDIAQRNQTEIFLKNLCFLKQGGIGILCVKARSIDVSKKPKDIFKEVQKKLSSRVKILEKIDISHYQKDHIVFVIQND